MSTVSPLFVDLAKKRARPILFLARAACLMLGATLLFVSSGAFAATYFSRATGNWNAAGTWSTVVCGGVVAAAAPGAADDVQICNLGAAHTVTVTADATIASVTFNGGNQASTLTVNATRLLTVNGNVTVNAPTTGNDKILNVAANGRLTVNGNLALVGGGAAGQLAQLLIGNNAGTTVIVTGNLAGTVAGGAFNTRAAVTFSGAGTLNIGGNFANGGTFTASTGTVVFNGSGAGSVGSYTYRNLTVSKTTGAGIATTGAGTVTVGGALSVTGGTLELAGTTVAVTGTTIIAGGAAAGGTLRITSTTGTKTFTGAVTINTGAVPGVWDNSAVNEDVSMGGSLTNNGSFTSGTGIYTFQTTAGQSWAGTGGLTFSGNVVVNATRTNNTTTVIAGNLSGTSTLTNAATRSLKIGGNATITGLTGVAPNTIEYNGAGAQTGKVGGTAQYSNLIINSGGIVSFAGSFSINGDLTNNGNFSHTGAANTVTFNGTIAQNLKKTGTATNTTFVRLALNNTALVATRQLILDHNVTVTTLLTLTAGRITTGAANNVYVSNGSAIASPGGNDFVEGNLRKPYAGAALSRVFEVGNNNGTSKYTPVTLAFAAVSVAGDVTVSTTNANHPQFASSGLDAANHVNRYWTITKDLALAFTTYTLTLTYIAGAPAAGDIDAAATAPAFIATRYDGTNWNTTTLNSIPTTTQTVLTGVTAVGDFAVGEALGYNGTPANLGRFNAYDPAPATPAGSVQGYIRTKTVATAFTLTIAHLTAGALAAGTGNVQIDLLDATPVQGPLINNCSANWTTVIATRTIAFAGTTTLTVTFPAIGAGSVPNSWKNVRVRATGTSGAVNGRIGCSTDAFAIIPSSFGVTVSDGTSSTTGTTNTLNATAFNGTPVHKAGLPFSVRVNSAVPVTATNYYQVTANAGSPALKTKACVNPTGGSPACALACNTGNLALGAFSVVSGELNSTATYDEAGVFDLTLDDTAYASVDIADTTLALRTVPQSAAFRTGRFIPNDFLLTVFPANTPQLQTFGVPDASCNASAPAPKRSFTYVGQSFGYVTAPKVLVTARNGLGSPTATKNYQQCLWRLAASDVTRTPSTSNAGKTLNSSLSSPAVVSLDDNSGTGTVTLNSSDSYSFSRSATTPDTPFNAIINLAVTATDADAVPSNTLDFLSIGFDGGGASSGTEMRYGRLKLLNAYGSELLPLRVPVWAEYYDSGSWKVNTADSCTTIPAGTIAIGNVKPVTSLLNPSPTLPVTLSSGQSTIVLTQGASKYVGSVDIALNLNPAATIIDVSCNTTHPATAAGANLPWLQGNWCGLAGYVRDPNARIKFGSPKAPYIYLRERY